MSLYSISAADVLSICDDHPDVEHARVTVDKPHALRFADSVSLTVESGVADPEPGLVTRPRESR